MKTTHIKFWTFRKIHTITLYIKRISFSAFYSRQFRMVLFTRTEVFPYEGEKWGGALCLAPPCRYAMQEWELCSHTILGSSPRLRAHWHRASTHSSMGSTAREQHHRHRETPEILPLYHLLLLLLLPCYSSAKHQEHMKLPARHRRQRGRGGMAQHGLQEKIRLCYSWHLTEGKVCPKVFFCITGRHWF